MRSKDAFSLGLAVTNNAVYNPDSTQGPANPSSGYPAITVQVNNQTVQGDTNYSVPVVFPYGIISIPPDGLYGVTLNFQAGTISPCVLGFVPAYANLFPLQGMVKGESALYNVNYSVQANLNGLHAKLASIEATANMLWGENVVKVLLDIISYLQASNSLLSDLVSKYNAHTHDTPPGPGLTPGSSEPGTVPFPPDLTQDQTDLEAGKAYLNNTGAPMT